MGWRNRWGTNWNFTGRTIRGRWKNITRSGDFSGAQTSPSGAQRLRGRSCISSRVSLVAAGPLLGASPAPLPGSRPRTAHPTIPRRRAATPLRQSTLPSLRLRVETREPLSLLDLHLSEREVRAGQSSAWVVLQQETRCLFPVVSGGIAPCLIQKRRAMRTIVCIAGQEVHQAALHQFVARRFRRSPESSHKGLGCDLDQTALLDPRLQLGQFLL